MRIIDTHTHIDFKDFDKDRDEVIRNAFNSGISDIIVSATTADRWPLIKKICVKHDDICRPAYGLHPMFMNTHNLDEDLLKLESWMKINKAVAISEIGLDYYIEEADHSHRKKQEMLFVAQCEIASSHNLPVIIHARKSLDIVLKHLRKFPSLRGSVHSFSGSYQQAKQLIDLGFYLSFGGPVTYNRATRLHNVLQSIPLSALLVETDSPDQPDVKHHSKRNEPSYIHSVIEKISELKGVNKKIIAEETTKNAIKLFDLGSL